LSAQKQTSIDTEDPTVNKNNRNPNMGHDEEHSEDDSIQE